MEFKRTVSILVLVVVCLVLVVPSVVHVYPGLMGADESYLVLSGSMRPALRPGDLVIVEREDPAKIGVGDLVTVDSGELVFTHRVVEKRVGEGVYRFRTKGDANEDPDPGWTEASQIIGKTVVTFPLGYLYLPSGYVLAFLVPCLLLVGKQVYRVFSLFKRRSKRELRRWRRQDHPVLDTSSVLLLTVLVMSGVWLVAPYFQVGSFGYFSDREWPSASLTAGQWVETVEGDIHPETLNLGSEGRWVTVRLNFASLPGYTLEEVKLDTILLENEIPAVRGKRQGGDVFMVKFNRTSLINYLTEAGYGEGDTVDLAVTGQFGDRTSFQGSDTIKLEGRR